MIMQGRWGKLRIFVHKNPSFMEESFDYNQVPTYFVHCFNGGCPRAEECLRQLAARHVEPTRPTVEAVSPAVWPADGASCAWFRPIRRIRMAWGVRGAIARMPYNEGRLVVKALNQMYPKVTLNRITTHERPLPPAEQRRIEALFASHGVTDGQVFDRVEMGYEW